MGIASAGAHIASFIDERISAFLLSGPVASVQALDDLHAFESCCISHIFAEPDAEPSRMRRHRYCAALFGSLHKLRRVHLHITKVNAACEHLGNAVNEKVPAVRV